jgi:transketolase
LSICIEAKKLLKDLKVRVVSFPCWELFEKQDLKYKESVFTDGVPVISVEAGSINGWAKYAHGSIGMTTFGASGKEKDVLKHFGFTPENIAEKVKVTIQFYKGKNVPDLIHRPF